MLIEVVGAIIRRENRVLIVQRPDDADMGGLWEFPGGKVEPGESHQQALARELREELAIEVEVADLYLVSEYERPPAYLIRLYFYNCRISSGDPRLLWGQDYRWAAPAELTSYTFPPADVDLVRRLAQTDVS